MKLEDIPPHIVAALKPHEQRHLRQAIAGKTFHGSDVCDYLRDVGAARVDFKNACDEIERMKKEATTPATQTTNEEATREARGLRLDPRTATITDVVDALIEDLPEMADADAALNGGDAVDVLCSLWPALLAARARARHQRPRQVDLFAAPSPPEPTKAATATTRTRGKLRPLGVDPSLPFTPGRWTVATSGRSVNLPDGGKLRCEKRDDESRLAADMRLIQCGPALYAVAQDFRFFLTDAGAPPDDRSDLARWIDALMAWVATGDDSYVPEGGMPCARCGHSQDAHGSERGVCQYCPKKDRHHFIASGVNVARVDVDDDDGDADAHTEESTMPV